MQRHDEGAVPAFDGNWQQLWISTLARPWNSLALVPVEQGIHIERLAESFVAAGQEFGARQVRLLNAVGTKFADAQKVIDALAGLTASGDLVVVPVNPLPDNPGVVPIVRATSGALLVVRLGQSRLAAARRTVEAIGLGRVFGSIVLE